MLQFFKIHWLIATCVWEIRAGLLMPMNHCNASGLALCLWAGPWSAHVSFLKWTLTRHFRASMVPWSLQNKDFSGGQQGCCVLDLLHQPLPAPNSPHVGTVWMKPTSVRALLCHSQGPEHSSFLCPTSKHSSRRSQILIPQKSLLWCSWRILPKVVGVLLVRILLCSLRSGSLLTRGHGTWHVQRLGNYSLNNPGWKIRSKPSEATG